MRFRKLRIAWSVFWGILALLLCVGWAFALLKSEFEANGLNARGTFSTIAINRGSVAYARFDTSKLPAVTRDGQRIQSSTKPVGWNLRLSSLKSGTQSFLLDSTNAYFIIQAPDWCLVTLTALLAGLPWLRRRFSLRTLLIATTLVAVVLGLAVWAARQ